MSILTDLTSIASNALRGDLTGLVEQVKKAIADGQVAESPVGKIIAEKVVALLPPGSFSFVESVDALLPDSLEVSLGITPEIKAFIKKAVSVHQVAPSAK